MTGAGDPPRAGEAAAAPALDQSDPAVEVRGLSAGYDDRLVVHDLSFTVPRGRIVCLVGGSGCGKSTVIRTLVGLLRPMAGTVRVLGRDPLHLGENERSALLRRVGMLFQGGALLGSLSVGDNVALALREHTDLPDGVIRRIVEQKLALVGLEGTADLLPAQLSGGMRKRAAISRALALDPTLLVCDEPSAGLDPVVAAGLDATLRRLQQRLGMTMVVVTHELASIGVIADHVVMLARDGHLLAQGSVAELRQSAQPGVREFFQRSAPSAAEAATGQSLLAALEAEPERGAAPTKHEGHV